MIQTQSALSLFLADNGCVFVRKAGKETDEHVMVCVFIVLLSNSLQMLIRTSHSVVVWIVHSVLSIDVFLATAIFVLKWN